MPYNCAPFRDTLLMKTGTRPVVHLDVHGVIECRKETSFCYKDHLMQLTLMAKDRFNQIFYPNLQVMTNKNLHQKSFLIAQEVFLQNYTISIDFTK